MAHQLKLLKDDFFASDQQAVAVADRYPQDVFAEHTVTSRFFLGYLTRNSGRGARSQKAQN
ncbi:hypothetical protein ACNISV_22195, partial [Escherichia coli]